MTLPRFSTQSVPRKSYPEQEPSWGSEASPVPCLFDFQPGQVFQTHTGLKLTILEVTEGEPASRSWAWHSRGESPFKGVACLWYSLQGVKLHSTVETARLKLARGHWQYLGIP